MRNRTALAAFVAAVALVMAVAPDAHADRAPTGRSAAQAPSGLRVAGQARDALVGTARPTLSWTVNDSGRSEVQTGYEVHVVELPSDRDLHGTQVWDSGPVNSAVSTGVPYVGPELRSERSLTAPITNDTWNRLDLDVSGWAPRNDITSIDVSFSGVGSTVAWGGRFQIDDLQWTDQQA